MPHKTKIEKNGNSLVVSLPIELLDELGLEPGDMVSVELIGHKIEIAPAGFDYNQAMDRGRQSATLYRNVLPKDGK
jgi:antitoxin component of MazEF toxin-antitoxin module